MYDQPRQKPLAASTLWSDGHGSRPPVDGTLPRSAGTFAGSSSGRLQREIAAPVPTELAHGPAADTAGGTSRPMLTMLARGRERFDIFCSPCHSIAGDGDGMVVRRGFPAPPSFHIERLRTASDAHFYEVITHGHGVMYPYADRVPPADRLAIIAYIRALQLAQHAPVALVPAGERAAIEALR